MNRRCHLVCLLLLTLVFTTTYSTNMLVAELFFDRLGGLLPYVLVILFLTSIPNFSIISPIFYEQLYEHVAVESAVSHKKGEILPRHIPSPPLTTGHLLEVLIGVCFCNFS